jgi:hypothetical protein
MLNCFNRVFFDRCPGMEALGPFAFKLCCGQVIIVGYSPYELLYVQIFG